MFHSPALARVDCFCGSTVMPSLMSPTSETNSVKVKFKCNLVRLTKNSYFELNRTAPTQGARSFIGIKKLFYAYRGTLTCENS